MRLAKLREFFDELNALECGRSCKHGHACCSVRTGGRCSNELWEQQCDDESDEEYEQRIADDDFLEEDE